MPEVREFARAASAPISDSNRLRTLVLCARADLGQDAPRAGFGPLHARSPIGAVQPRRRCRSAPTQEVSRFHSPQPLAAPCLSCAPGQSRPDELRALAASPVTAHRGARYLHPRRANASAIASIRPRIRVGVFLGPTPHTAAPRGPCFCVMPLRVGWVLRLSDSQTVQVTGARGCACVPLSGSSVVWVRRRVVAAGRARRTRRSLRPRC